MFTSRLKPLTLAALVALLLFGRATDPAYGATAEEIKKQQDQIRERSKDIEDKARADKQAHDREEARKAQELREKQWKEEHPNSPFPRGGNADPSHQAQRPPAPSGGIMIAPPLSGDPNARAVQAAMVLIDKELKSLNQRLQKLEQLLNTQGQSGSTPHSGSTPPRPVSHSDAMTDQQAQIRERSRAQAEVNEKEWADLRKAQEQRNNAENSERFITPSVVADYYLGPKEPRLRR